MSRQQESDSPLSADDPRLVGLVREYLTELEAGRRPDRRAFAARHPDLAEALASCLDGLELMHGATALLGAVSGAVPTGLPESYPANPLGDFRIVREIGRGGMGVVYEAVQLSLGRRVALKVLPFAAAFDARHLQRFKNEAQAAAQLHHQNIVPVYFVGCERGVHFYAMQLIEGQSVAALIRALRQAEERGTRTQAEPRPLSSDANSLTSCEAVLSTQRSGNAPAFYRRVAELGVQAAEALEHAHEFGVIHRDVKPANLLLDGRGRLWVTDFGLAQFRSDAELTNTGDIVGTLRYMSPEQAAGRRVLLDHRTDVYSLGATLYEMLTLEPIFPGENRQVLLQQILNDEPRAPRSVAPALPAELETIVLKAVSKNPVERYGSARELADDLQRFLQDKPILARRPRLHERARKWARRHPSVVGAALVLLAFGVVGLLVNNWMVSRERARTAAAYERERLRAEEAEKRFQQARNAVDLLIQICEQDLVDRPGSEGLRRRLLEAVLVYYQDFIEQRRDDPGDRADLSATQERVKKILADLAALQGAGQLYLLNDAGVLDDLHADDDQRGRLAEFFRHQGERGMEVFREFRQLTPEERRQRFLDFARANEAAVAAILSPGQIRRLRQVALQARGPMAFREPDVAASLKLTAEQRERIRAIEADTFFGPAEPLRPGFAPPPSRKVFEQRLRAAVDRIQALLTEEQAKRWKEMTGEPFKGPLPGFPPGPGGPFGPAPR
jgi:serine/threonine protein kinase